MTSIQSGAYQRSLLPGGNGNNNASRKTSASNAYYHDNSDDDDDEEEDLRKRQASASAMNLFEKYSNLNRGIEEVRNEMKQTRLKTEEINETVVKCQQERAAMRSDIEAAKEEANDFHKQVDQANEALFRIQEDRGRAAMEQQHALQELQRVKNFVEEQRRQFLDQSREFRASCKRVRLRASSGLGLEYAPLRAFATVVAATTAAPGDAVTNPASHLLSNAFEENNDSIYGPADERELVIGAGATNAANNKDNERSSIKSDPRQWIPDSRDEEMILALERYKSERKLYEQVQQSLEETTTQLKTAKDRADSRARKKEQLLAQLNKIKKDHNERQQELETLEQETIESRELGKAFEKDVKTRRQEFAQQRFEAGIAPHAQARNGEPVNNRTRGQPVAAPAHNPYAKKSQQSATATATAAVASNNGDRGRAGNNRLNYSSSKQQSKRTSKTTTTSTTQTQRQSFNSSSYLQQQHPHRAGRIRLDRQFTSNLSIFAASDPSTDNLAVAIETDQSNDPSNNRSTNNASELATKSHLNVNDDSDDDDDDLLSFDPFSKKY